MSRRRGELYRNPEGAKIAGVCSGIADYFGWEAWLVRIIVVSAVLFGMPFLIFAYIACWFILNKKPITANQKVQQNHQARSASDEFSAEYSEHASESIKVKARFWQAGEPPKQAFHDIRLKFSHLEKQLQAIEQYVTSAEFTVSREINNL